MGHTPSQQYLQQQYQIIKIKQDGSALLRHHKTKDEYLLRNICSNIIQQISQLQQLMKKRQILKSPHLLQLIQIKKKQQKNVCSVVNKIHLLIQYPFKTLQDQINQKIINTKSNPFLQPQLWSILYSCSVALNTLYIKKMPHQSLTSTQIYISRDGLIKISDPLLLGLQKNYIRLLKKDNQHIHISPQIMNFLDDCNFSFYDKQKSDVFILGAILLEASLLKPINMYEKQTKRPLLETVTTSLTQLKSRYSHNYAEMLEKMLQFHSKQRPKFSQIISMIEDDNTLHQDTQTSDGRQPSLLPESLPHPPAPKPPKTQVKLHLQTNTLSKTTPINHLHSIPKNPNISNKINFIQSSSHQPKKKQQQTLIKLLQTSNMKSNHQASSGYRSGNSREPGSNQCVYFNSPKPNSFENTQILSNQNNQTQYHYINHPIANTVQPPPTIFKPLPNLTSITTNHPQIIPHPTNFLTKFIDPQNQRFSYTKFGHITLDLQKNKNRPLYSHQIPQINQILKNQNYNNPHLTHQLTPSISQPHQLINISTPSPPPSTHLTYLPNYSSNPTPQTKCSNLQHQKTTQTTHPTHFHSNQSSSHNSSNYIDKNIQNNKIQPQSINRQHESGNTASQPQTRKLSLSYHPFQQSSKNNTTKSQTSPQLKGSHDPTTKSINYHSLSQPKQSRPSSSIQKPHPHPHPKSQLLTKLKQKPRQATNTIFAVTQNSQQNQQSSPIRNSQSPYDPHIKLNQPQKSPGPNPDKSINDNLFNNQQPTLCKSIDDQPHFVTINIQNGGKYQGYIFNGMKNGEGKLEFNDGGYYLGEWKDNKMHGYGKLYYQNGQVAYQGNWQSDQFCGEGRVFNDRPEKLLGSFNYHDFADLGQKWIYYEGQFKNDSKHGRGKIRLTNGEVFEGNFIFDSIQGYGTYYTNSGQAINGFWKDNVLADK